MVRLLIERGADVARAGVSAFNLSVRSRCEGCVDAILEKLPASASTPAMTLDAGPGGTGARTVALLARGADASARSSAGFPAIVLAAASGSMPETAAAALLARGADVNAPGPNDETALAFARRNGRTSLVDTLVRAGAKDAAPLRPALKYAPAASLRDAALRSLPLLQRADVGFFRTAGCISCHHNSQTAETVALARTRRLPVDEAIATAQRQKFAAYLDDWRERTLVGQGIPGEADTISVILVGLAAERHPPDLATDAMARFVRLQQAPEGYWRVVAHRPPIESGDVTVTAQSLRALQAYAPLFERPLADAAIRRAAEWLARAQADDTQERTYRLLGLHWAGASQAALSAAAQRLASGQRADGGWSQITSLESDAYATGQALVALLSSGMMTAKDPAVQRGLGFLRTTQLADGSWFVARRAIPIQPYFETGFPHGRDQFISAAATNWATQALLYATKNGG